MPQKRSSTKLSKFQQSLSQKRPEGPPTKVGPSLIEKTIKKRRLFNETNFDVEKLKQKLKQGKIKMTKEDVKKSRSKGQKSASSKRKVKKIKGAYSNLAVNLKQDF